MLDTTLPGKIITSGIIALLLLLAPVVHGQQTERAPLNLQQELPTDDAWWKMFGDNVLTGLIGKAVTNNNNILNAMDNIDIARAKMQVSRSGFYPTISLTGSYTAEKTSRGIENIDQRDNIGEAMVSANWELDVFGAIRKEARAQKQLYMASQEEYRAVMISLIAQLSTAYIDLRTAQKQLDVATQNLKSQQEILELTETRFKTGLASQLSVAQAKGIYLQTKATIPAMEAEIYRNINTICILTGEFSDEQQRLLQQTVPLPLYPGNNVSGIPADLIRRRPDVRAAERQMDALTQAAGASRADWWPKFFVNGSFGYGSRNFRQFTQEENMTWQVVPSIKWTIFNGRQTVQKTRIAMLQLDNGINSFNNTVLTAVGEVDDAITAYNSARQQVAADRDAFAQASETLALSVELYRKGLADYLSVLDAQRTVFSYENALVTAESNTLTCLISLYKAIGGGWTEKFEN